MPGSFAVTWNVLWKHGLKEVEYSVLGTRVLQGSERRFWKENTLSRVKLQRQAWWGRAFRAEATARAKLRGVNHMARLRNSKQPGMITANTQDSVKQAVRSEQGL